ncbi:MAG: sce7725 family protein [Dethiosulfatibacter sp.]|nr:sce7725 family protein [Dethiosulfatibacter sp.]
MYLPYLRGRQFELIALRELVEKEVLSEKVIPIIEPVKLSSTLIKTITKYKEEDRVLCIIANPQVGGFYDDYQDSKNEKLVEQFNKEISETDTLLFAKILKPKDASAEAFIEKHGNSMITICTNKDAIAIHEKYFADQDVKFNLIPDDSGFRRKIRSNRVMLDDKFNKLERNTDYSKIDDEPFSEDHLFYLEDGYKGFADYSVVGNEYSDTGFAPYAVAIHIVYFADDDSLRVKHFVSDSNDDISDPAGKFREALSKLVEWNQTMRLNTLGMMEFEDLYKREAYPGLGTVKKLSIMHHFELLGNYLDKE